MPTNGRCRVVVTAATATAWPSSACVSASDTCFALWASGYPCRAEELGLTALERRGDTQKHLKADTMQPRPEYGFDCPIFAMFAHRRATPRRVRRRWACSSGFGFHVSGSGAWVPGTRFRASGSGFRVSSSGFRILGSTSRVSGVAIQILGFESHVSGSGFRLLIFGFQVPGSWFRGSGFGFRISVSNFRISVSGFRVSIFGGSGAGLRVSPPPGNVADSCDLTETTKPTQPSIVVAKVVPPVGARQPPPLSALAPLASPPPPPAKCAPKVNLRGKTRAKSQSSQGNARQKSILILYCCP